MERKICFRCKQKPIWVGSKELRIRNFWGLYCKECEKIESEEMKKINERFKLTGLKQNKFKNWYITNYGGQDEKL